jgi:antitoxin CcdA
VPPTSNAARKSAANLTSSEILVAKAKTHSSNLSATVEELLAVYQQLADACVADWNAVHDKVGSFADEHSTL